MRWMATDDCQTCTWSFLNNEIRQRRRSETALTARSGAKMISARDGGHIGLLNDDQQLQNMNINLHRRPTVSLLYQLAD